MYVSQRAIWRCLCCNYGITALVPHIFLICHRWESAVIHQFRSSDAAATRRCKNLQMHTNQRAFFPFLPSYTWVWLFIWMCVCARKHARVRFYTSTHKCVRVCVCVMVVVPFCMQAAYFVGAHLYWSCMNDSHSNAATCHIAKMVDGNGWRFMVTHPGWLFALPQCQTCRSKLNIIGWHYFSLKHGPAAIVQRSAASNTRNEIAP